MLKGDTNTADDNLVGWKLASATSTMLEINLEFNQPMEVS